MTRQLEQRREDRQVRRDALAVYALEYGLVDAVSALGGVLTGFSLNYGGADCMLVLKMLAGDEKRVCFVGGLDPISCIVKASRQASADELNWRKDKF